MDERERFQRLSELFDRARDLHEQDAAEFVAAVEDAGLREELREMLTLDRKGTPEVRTIVDLTGVLDEPDPKIDIPAQIGGYTVLGVVGFGVSGVVLRARQPATDRVVAIKVLGSGAWNPSALQRFRREIRLLGRLEHSGIARIYDSGTDTSSVPSRPYFVMEYVAGQPLNRWASDDGKGRRREPHEIARVFAAIADAIQYAHQAGVIHRDLKPGNVLVSKAAAVKVLDFGVSGVTEGVGHSSSSSSGSRMLHPSEMATLSLPSLGNSVVGTVPYMSPEQFDGTRAVDTRSDLYSIGVMLYECLVGELPYKVDPRALTEAATIIREEVPSALGTVDRSLRGDLEVVVARLLEKDPAKRYQSAAELAVDLRLFEEGKPTMTRPVSSVERARRFARRYRALIAGTLAVFAVLVGFLGYTINLWRQSENRGNALAKALDASERLEYRRAIRDAEAALRGGGALDARRALASVPVERQGWEWRYLAARAGAESEVIELPTMPVSIQRGSGFLIIGCVEGAVYRIEQPLGEPELLFRRQATISEIALSPDGREFIVVDASDPALSVHSSRDGSVLRRFETGVGAPTGIAWSQDGALLAVSSFGGATSVLRARTGEIVRTFDQLIQGPRAGEGLVRFLPGSNGILFGCRASNEARVVTSPAADPIRLDLRGGVVERLGGCIGRDGAIALVGLYSGAIAPFDASDGSPMRIISAHAGAVRAIAAGPGPYQFTSGATDGAIRVWDVDSGTVMGTAVGAELQVRGLDFDLEHGELLAVGEDGYIRSWNIAREVAEPVLREHRAWVYSLAFLQDGTLVSGAGEAPQLDGRLLFWQLDSSQAPVAVELVPKGRPSIVWSIRPDPLGHVLASSDRGIKFVARDGSVTSHDLPSAAFAVDFVNGGNWIAAHRFDSRSLDFFRRDGSLAQTLDIDSGRLGPLTARKEGSELFAGSGGVLTLYGFRRDAAFAKREWKVEGTITDIAAIDGSDRVVLGIYGGEVALLDTSREGADAVLWRQMACPDQSVRVALAPDGSRIAVCGKNPVVRILDASDGQQVLALGGHGDAVLSLAFSPDGSTLATGAIDGTVRIWRAAAGGFAFASGETAPDAAQRGFRSSGPR